jgi:hypothetical protein
MILPRHVRSSFVLGYLLLALLVSASRPLRSSSARNAAEWFTHSVPISALHSLTTSQGIVHGRVSKPNRDFHPASPELIGPERAWQPMLSVLTANGHAHGTTASSLLCFRRFQGRAPPSIS